MRTDELSPVVSDAPSCGAGRGIRLAVGRDGALQGDENRKKESVCLRTLTSPGLSALGITEITPPFLVS